MLDLSIIIVNWNTEKLIKECIDSIYRNTHDISFEVFVVDNNSADNSVNVIKDNFPHVKLIENKSNNGFAKANNQAIKSTAGKYILLLNPDTIVLDKALDIMVNYLNNHSDVGILGCKLLNPDKTLQESCRKFPSMKAYTLILLKMHHLFPNSKPLKEYFMRDMNYDMENEVEQVMGAVLMYRRDVLGVNPSFLDEDYWIWFEEVDFCYNAKKNNYKIMYIPYANIVHYKAQSFNQVMRVKQQKNFINSIKTYFKKNGGEKDLLILSIISPISIFISYLVQSLKLFRFKRRQD